MMTTVTVKIMIMACQGHIFNGRRGHHGSVDMSQGLRLTKGPNIIISIGFGAHYTILIIRNP